MVADQWKEDPSLLFNTTRECINQVRKGNRVYPEVNGLANHFFKFANVYLQFDLGSCNSISYHERRLQKFWK